MEDKLKRFFSEKGYATAVYSCIALVVVLAAGVAFYDTVTLKKTDKPTEESGEPVYDSPVSRSKDKSYKEQITEAPTEKAKSPENVTSKPEAKADNKPAQTEPVSESSGNTGTTEGKNLFAFDENTQEMIMPAQGRIVMDYSPDIAVFDATLEQYRTNNSICIAADEGSAVVASADGVIGEVGFDETMGHFLTIDHGNGWMSTYSQLGENIPMAVGDIVNAGETVAYVGEPTVFGSALGPHLEFYITHNDEYEDPKLLFESED